MFVSVLAVAKATPVAKAALTANAHSVGQAMVMSRNNRIPLDIKVITWTVLTRKRCIKEPMAVPAAIVIIRGKESYIQLSSKENL